MCRLNIIEISWRRRGSLVDLSSASSSIKDSVLTPWRSLSNFLPSPCLRLGAVPVTYPLMDGLIFIKRARI